MYRYMPQTYLAYTHNNQQFRNSPKLLIIVPLQHLNVYRYYYYIVFYNMHTISTLSITFILQLISAILFYISDNEK